MIKVQIIATGEIKELTRNEAFGLIDKKVAKIYRAETPGYENRMLKVKGKSKVK